MARRRIGIYNRNMAAGGGAEKRCAVLAERLSRNHDVTFLVSRTPSISSLERYFSVDLSRVNIVRLQMPVHRELGRGLDTPLAPFLRRACLDLLLDHAERALERRYFRQIRELGLDLFINNQGASVLPCPAPAGIYMCMFPHDRRGELRRDHGRGRLFELYARLGDPVVGMTDRVLDSYDVITANSEFTAHWIERLWRRPSEVVYTACEDMGPPAPKEKIIMNVGRFVSGERNDNKRQHTLIEAFRSMTDLHREGWELHLAGSLSTVRASRVYFAHLSEAARGLPLRLHPNAGFSVLCDLYRRASIYWHATGYGMPSDKHPGKQEHFGITTVEAMSAGAVPVVINSGGQRESVEDGVCGYLWNDLDELRCYTRKLAGDPGLLANFRGRAVERSARFRRSKFADRVEALAERILAAAVTNSGR